MLQNSCTPIRFTFIHGNFTFYYIQIWCVIQKDHFVQALKSKFLYNIEDAEFYFLIPLWMQKYVKNENRYRLIKFICLLAVYKKNDRYRVLVTRILRYVEIADLSIRGSKTKDADPLVGYRAADPRL